MLRQLGVVIGKNTKAERVFDSLFPNFFEVNYSTPSEYIAKYWNQYQAQPEKSNSLNGKIFEYILATLCIREGLLPLYLEAQVAFVPNVEYDLMFYTKERGPICWSAKTTLRERYKQADLEAIALKYVHRKALSHLITLSADEARSVQQKIKTGDVIGLDAVVVATSTEFDNLVKQLKQYNFEEPPTVQVIASTQVVTEAKVKLIQSC
jgi:hypothetical protein